MQVAIEGFGRPLRNPVHVGWDQAGSLISAKASGVRSQCQNRVWQLSDWGSWVAVWRPPALSVFLLRLQQKYGQGCAIRQRAGAFVAGSPREAASGADIIISMVADDVASRGVWLGENGALAGATRGSVLIESQHAHRGLDQGTRSRCGATRMRAAGCAGHRHQAPCGIGELVFLVGGRMRRSPRRSPSSRCWAEKHSSGPTGSGALHEAHQQFHVRRAGGFTCGSRGSMIKRAA